MGLFRRNRWKMLPSYFLQAIQARLGGQDFALLVKLGDRYKLLEHPYFQRTENLGADVDEDILTFTGLLASLGNAIAPEGRLADAETAFTLCLRLQPDYWPAYGSLALVYAMTGKSGDAVYSAKRALAGLESEDDDLEDDDSSDVLTSESLNERRMVLDRLFPPEEAEGLRMTMLEIVESGGRIQDNHAFQASDRSERLAKDTIAKLTALQKSLFLDFLSNYTNRFPADSEITNLHRAGVVLNELLEADHRGDALSFRQANAAFVTRETEEMMRAEDTRLAVTVYLAVKVGLVRLRKGPNADKWAERAKRRFPGLRIPGTWEDLQRTIDGCLTMRGVK